MAGNNPTRRRLVVWETAEMHVHSRKSKQRQTAQWSSRGTPMISGPHFRTVQTGQLPTKTSPYKLHREKRQTLGSSSLIARLAAVSIRQAERIQSERCRRMVDEP